MAVSDECIKERNLPMKPPDRGLGRTGLIIVALVSVACLGPGASAAPADDAALAACRANPEVGAVPRAAELGCACAVDAMAPLDDSEKQAIADGGFTPDSFERVARSHPALLVAVRDCLAPDQD